MFDWLKSKKKTADISSAASPSSSPVASLATRDDLVRDAIRNTKIAQDNMGKETVDRLIRIMREKEEISPADQAKKIIAHMDHTRLGHFMRFLVADNQTKH